MTNEQLAANEQFAIDEDGTTSLLSAQMSPMTQPFTRERPTG
jgi:hypothetical protein